MAGHRLLPTCLLIGLFTHSACGQDVEQRDQEKPNIVVIMVEVEASFATSNPKESSAFQIRLGLFSQEPEAVRPIWNDHELLFDTVLGHVGRNYTTEPGEQTGWHKLRANIEVPPGTRSIVISLGAGDDEPSPTTSDHFVDAVRVRLVDTFGSGD